jgi:hypothetical protein
MHVPWKEKTGLDAKDLNFMCLYQVNICAEVVDVGHKSSMLRSQICCLLGSAQLRMEKKGPENDIFRKKNRVGAWPIAWSLPAQ